MILRAVLFKMFNNSYNPGDMTITLWKLAKGLGDMKMPSWKNLAGVMGMIAMGAQGSVRVIKLGGHLARISCVNPFSRRVECTICEPCLEESWLQEKNISMRRILFQPATTGGANCITENLLFWEIKIDEFGFIAWSYGIPRDMKSVQGKQLITIWIQYIKWEI